MAQTPNGSYFAYTPGGSKICYGKNFLMQVSASPHCASPLELPVIKGVTVPNIPEKIEEKAENEFQVVKSKSKSKKNREQKHPSDEHMFEME